MSKKREIKVNGGSDEESLTTAPDEQVVTDDTAQTAGNETSAREDTSSDTAAAPDELTRLRARVAELEDRLLRAQAEYENSLRRTTRINAESVRLAAERPLADLLEVVDNFERALEHAADENNKDSLLQGMEMIHKQLLDLLARYNVRPIPAMGERFDPALHEALLQIESEDHDEGVVAQEINRGYMVDDRVLRHSRVAVSKGKPPDSDE